MNYFVSSFRFDLFPLGRVLILDAEALVALEPLIPDMCVEADTYVLFVEEDGDCFLDCCCCSISMGTS